MEKAEGEREGAGKRIDESIYIHTTQMYKIYIRVVTYYLLVFLDVDSTVSFFFSPKLNSHFCSKNLRIYNVLIFVC